MFLDGGPYQYSYANLWHLHFFREEGSRPHATPSPRISAPKHDSYVIASWSVIMSLTGQLYLSQCMSFLTIRYVPPAMPQISLRIRAAWSEPLLVAWVFYECYATDWTPFGVSKLKRRLQRLVWVYTCQNATLLEISWTGSLLSYLQLTWNFFPNTFTSIHYCVANVACCINDCVQTGRHDIQCFLWIV